MSPLNTAINIRKTTTYFFILFLLSLAEFSYAQSTTAPAAIYANSIVKKNAIIIRWIPADYKTWKLGNRYGYRIERITSNANPDTTLFNTGATILTPSAITPANQTDSIWKKLERENPGSALIYSDLYTLIPKANVKKEEQTLWGLLMLTTNTSATIAKAAGLYYKDSAVNNNSNYAYRISLIKNNETKGIRPQIIVVNASAFTKLAAAPDSVRLKFSDRMATLKWKVVTNDYDSYNIERSEDSINFKRINKSPYVLMASQYEKNKTTAVYTDSVGKNNSTFYYRIKGVTPFGEEGTASRIVKGQGRSTFTLYPLIDTSKVIGNKKTVLVWHMPKGFQKKLLKGYAISRADNDKGKYVFITPSLLSPDQQRYEDPAPLTVNYYKIMAISFYGDTAASFSAFAQLQDLTPPLPPTGLTGKADTKGIVTLNWEVNNEADLMGYRVFRSNSLTEEFVEVTRKILTAPVFTDTIVVRTLTKNIYYQLTAVDKVHNNSAYCTALKIKRPDVIAPVEPVFTNVTQNPKGILLKWIPSSSEDVMKYELIRYNVSTNIPVTLKTWTLADSTSTFMDSTVTNNTKYTYILNVTDDSENKSKKISAIISYVSGIPPVITDITAIADRKQSKIIITWKYTEADVYNYILYKGKKGEPLRIYKTFGASIVKFEDMDSPIGNTYTYKLKAILNSGTETPLSKGVDVVY